jgi:hypothetical protein
VLLSITTLPINKNFTGYQIFMEDGFYDFLAATGRWGRPLQ